MSNEDILRALITVHNGGWQIDAALQFLSPQFVEHLGGGPEMHNRDSWQQATEGFARAFPDYEAEVHDIVCHQDRAAARTTWRGTHTGEMDGIPPSGKRVEVSLIGFYRFDNGLVIEAWIEQNTLGMLQQMGVIPIA